MTSRFQPRAPKAANNSSPLFCCSRRNCLVLDYSKTKHICRGAKVNVLERQQGMAVAQSLGLSFGEGAVVLGALRCIQTEPSEQFGRIRPRQMRTAGHSSPQFQVLLLTSPAFQPVAQVLRPWTQVTSMKPSCSRAARCKPCGSFILQGAPCAHRPSFDDVLSYSSSQSNKGLRQE